MQISNGIFEMREVANQRIIIGGCRPIFRWHRCYHIASPKISRGPLGPKKSIYFLIIIFSFHSYSYLKINHYYFTYKIYQHTVHHRELAVRKYKAVLRKNRQDLTIFIFLGNPGTFDLNFDQQNNHIPFINFSSCSLG